MDEAKRFIRYVIPGLCFFVQLFVIKSIWQIDLNDFFSLNEGFVIFLASGAIGFLVSNLYFLLFWYILIHLTKLSYSKIIKDFLTIFKNYKEISSLSEKESSSLMTTFWEMDHSGNNQGITEVVKGYVNVFHSIGTTMTILLLGLIFGVYILRINNESSNSYIAGNLIVIIILALNYLNTASMINNLYRRVFEKHKYDLINRGQSTKKKKIH